MKRFITLFLALLFVFSLSACVQSKTPGETTMLTEPSSSAETTTETTEATAPAPEHSALYIPGIPVEDVIIYFNEVCLDSEFVNSGDPSKVQKWAMPIYYALNGDYTSEDIATLTDFTAWLNRLDGFPGIYEAEDPTIANLRIHFVDQQTMHSLMGDDYANLDGGITFWYDGNDEIYDAIICYRTELDQYLRNSVIIEEIYNGLGPVQDTSLREDSIIYQGFSEPQQLTAVDKLLLQLLYHPDIQPGMNAQECEKVIRNLYY